MTERRTNEWNNNRFLRGFLIYSTGEPQILRGRQTVPVKKGDSADLVLITCADPRPETIEWEWGSIRLRSGDSLGMLYFQQL